MNTQFYLVYREGGEAPTKRHETLMGAELEAFRLAKKQPGDVFYILKAESQIAVEIPEPTIRRFSAATTWGHFFPTS